MTRGMDDFKKADGRIDWNAYREYEVGIGKRCYQCGALIYVCHGRVQTRMCVSCKDLNEKHDRDVTHDDFVRCPRCGNRDKISDWDCDYGDEKYMDGEHEITCGECDHEYTITTHCSYCYTSPKMLTEEEKKALDEKLGPGGG